MKKTHGVFMFSLIPDCLSVTLYNISSLSKCGVINVSSRPANSSRTNSFWGVTGLSRFWCFIDVIQFVSAVIHLNASLTHCSSETSCCGSLNVHHLIEKHDVTSAQVQVQSGLCCPLKAQVSRESRWGSTHSRAADRKHFHVSHS